MPLRHKQLRLRCRKSNRVIQFEDPRQAFISKCPPDVFVPVVIPTLLSKVLIRLGWFGAGAVSVAAFHFYTAEHRRDSGVNYEITSASDDIGQDASQVNSPLLDIHASTPE